MEQVKQILQASLLWRGADALCRWFGRQWSASALVYWFLHPVSWDRSLSESSLVFRIWSLVRRGLCRLYEVLKLDRLFSGSIFLHSWFWCALPVVLAPLAPTMAVLGLAAVGTASLALNLVRDPRRELGWAPANRYVMLYAGVYMVATIFSVTPMGSLKHGLLTVAFTLFCVVLCSAVRSRRQLDALLALFVTVGAVVSAYGILQYLFGWGYQSAAWVDSDMFSTISFRAASTLQNPNMLGQYLILTIPVGGACLLNAKDWLSRGFYFGCCALMCVCMLLTMSRGAWLGLLFAGAVFVVLLNPRLIMLAPFALVALYFVLPDTVISRFTSIGNLGDNSTSYRVFIWLGVLDMLKDYWLCGVGPGEAAFNSVYPAYSYNAIIAPHSHNLFLQIVCDAGIVALVVFFLVLIVYFRTTCCAISRETQPDSRLLQIAFTAGVCGFLVQAMTDYSFYNYRVMFLFWAYLALGSLCARRSELTEGGLSQ